ncbi:hypothetical protein G9A89_022392 [Geosiphon pyriformis]|nr:hypothetical protein G9A89_022392 [Geosiphon pyriformis]
MVRVVRTNINKQSWDARDNFRALLYTLPMGTTAYDFYSRTCCATVCFSSEVELVNTMATTPVIKGFGLCWSYLFLASCVVCKNFGHTSLSCRSVKDAGIAGGRKASFSVQDQSRLAKIYAKKSVPISRPLAFGGKIWVSVIGASSALSLSGSKTHFGFVIDGKSTPPVAKDLKKRLVNIENGLVSLAGQIDKLTKRLKLLVLVVPQPGHGCQLPVTFPPQNLESNVTVKMDLSMANGHKSATIVDLSTSPHVVKLENMLEGLSKSVLSLSTCFNSLVLASIAICNVRRINNPVKQSDVIHWHKNIDNSISIFTEIKLKDKFDGVWVFTTGLDSGYLGAGVVVVMNFFLAKHMCKVSEVPGWLMSIKLLFKNKLSVSILELYAGASSAVWFFQAGKINSIIAKAVNESSFVILSGDFNKNGSRKCASFKKCLDLRLINSLVGSLAVKMPTWENSRDVKRMIDYVFVSPNLVNVMVHHNVSGVSEHFDTDHQAVLVSLSLGRLLDMQLNFFRKQANRDRWKFNFKSTDESIWINFKCATLANATMFSDEFTVSVGFSDLDVMWDVVCKIMVLSANKVFKKKWFKKFNDVFTKEFSRFHKLELLVSKIIKAFRVRCAVDFASFMKCWASLDSVSALVIQDLVDSGVESDYVCSALFGVRKSYRAFKLIEFQSTKDANIKSAIDKRMESFEVDKDHTIRSVLEHPFCKVVLDYLVVDDNLILEPEQVKSKVDAIIKSWTRKRWVIDNVSDDWRLQYWLLEYVFDEAFSGVMCLIEYDKFFEVVSDLPDGKAAGLSGISNELWKHCDRSVLDMLLVLLNSCLFSELVSMIPKPYKWEGVLTNTRPIALIKTAHKILSKILSDRISLACSTFDVLRGANFLVLKSTTIQSPIFAIGSVVEDALEKNKKLWLNLVRIKICSKFIRFFGSIYRDCTNQVMTDFGLTSGYHVHDSLDQEEESVCRYRLNSHFVSKNDCSKSQAGFSSFFATGVFVDDTIWVGSSQTATQHILNVTSKFFCVNDISINNDKTVVIPINSRVSNPFLSISDLPISIAKKEESHRYLGIFLLTKNFSKSSLVKAHSDIRFFTNLVLKKTVTDKQFLYLVLAVLHPIVSYRTQFSFISVGMYNKWDALIHKGLKLKSGLLLDFPNDAIYYPSFYGLKSFFQVQSENKIASFVSFANSGGILSRLFFYRSHDLQVLCWCPVHLLSSPVCIHVSASNNFLTDMVCVFLDCNVSLGGSLVSSFWSHGEVPMFKILGESRFLRFLPSLWQYSIAFVDQLRDCHSAVYDWYIFKQWKKLDPRGPVPEWFKHSVLFLNSVGFSHTQSLVLGDGGPSNILKSGEFVFVCDHLLATGASSLSVYTDGSLSNLGMVGCKAGTAVFFEDIGLGLGVSILGLMLFTLVELQAVALALECVPSSSFVCLFLDSQLALNACRSELDLVYPNYHNQCWVERCHIVNMICNKKLRVSFHKVKGHSGVSGNKHADMIADAVSFSNWYLPPYLSEHFLSADGGIVSGNLRHFVHNIYHSICHVQWEVGSGSGVLVDSLSSEVDWLCLLLIWHPDLHMAADFTSRSLSSMHTYFIKSLHHQLPVVVQKCLYNRRYPSVLCLYCGEVEVSNHMFSCKLLDSYVEFWKALSGSFHSSLGILQLLSFSVSDFSVFMALFKDFVFNEWFCKAVSVFHNPKIAVLEIVKFVHSLGLAFREDVWSVRAKYHAYMEKNRLILLDGSAIILVHGLASRFSAGVVRLLGITNALGVHFGFRKSCLFFLGINESVLVYIAA